MAINLRPTIHLQPLLILTSKWLSTPGPPWKTPLRNNITKRINEWTDPFFHFKKPRGSFATSQRLSSAPHLTTKGGHLADHIEELSIHLYDIAAWYQDKKSYIARIASARDIKIDQILFLRSVPHVTRRARRAPTSKNNSCVTKTRNSHQYEANLKNWSHQGEQPEKLYKWEITIRKKNSVPSSVSHFVHLMDLRTDHTQVCASTSCAKAAKQTNTIPPRRVYLCRWTSKRPSTSSQPIELYNFPPITRGRINKTRRQMDAVFCAPTTQHPGHFHPKTFCKF